MNIIPQVALTGEEIMAQNITNLVAKVDSMNELNWLVTDDGGDDYARAFFKSYVEAIELTAVITAGCDLDQDSSAEDQVYAFGNNLLQLVSPQDARMIVETIARVGQPTAQYACDAIVHLMKEPLLADIRAKFCTVNGVTEEAMKNTIETHLDAAFHGVCETARVINEWYLEVITGSSAEAAENIETVK